MKGLVCAIFTLIILHNGACHARAFVDSEVDRLSWYYTSMKSGEVIDVYFTFMPQLPAETLDRIVGSCLSYWNCEAFSPEDYQLKLAKVWNEWMEDRKTTCVNAPPRQMPLPASFFNFVDISCITEAQLKEEMNSRTKWSCGHSFDFPVPSFKICGPIVRMSKS